MLAPHSGPPLLVLAHLCSACLVDHTVPLRFNDCAICIKDRYPDFPETGLPVRRSPHKYRKV